jgi:ATP synthase subunit 6
MTLLLVFFTIKNSSVLLDPLNQFEIFPWLINIFIVINEYINIPVYAITSGFFFLNAQIIFILFIFFYLFLFQVSKKTSISQNLNFFSFIRTQLFELTQTVVKNNVSLKQQYWFVILFFSFTLIIGLNIIGLIPYTFTLTSSFALTFFYSLIVFIIINISGIFRTGFTGFFSLFLPSGTPLNITFLLIIIEIISYFARLFSLSIRLFANMMAGHTLLKTLIGFSFSIIFNNLFFAPIALIPWILVVLIFILEILIAFLQGYVYLVLLCIYINDLLAGH